MKDFNKIILLGRLGADPILRETKAGVAVTHFPLATTRRTGTPTQATEGSDEVVTERGETTQWHRVVVWGKQGQHCAQYLKKGQSVLIEGSMRSHKFDGKDGKERVSYEVHAENVSFLPSGRKREVAEEDLLAASA